MIALFKGALLSLRGKNTMRGTKKEAKNRYFTLDEGVGSCEDDTSPLL